MKKFLVATLSLFISTVSYANTLTCNDERSDSYEVRISSKENLDINIGNGSPVSVQVYEDGQILETVYGNTLENCQLIGPESGAAVNEKICNVVLSKNKLGTLTLREEGLDAYDMILRDRNFRGYCTVSK